jgi:DNA-binding transcriptional ArsR family regulator
MAVTRLRSRRDTCQEIAILRLRGAAEEAAGAMSGDVAERICRLLDRELSSRAGWGFVMVEPRLYGDVVEHLLEHSKRPQKAVLLFTRLFGVLPPDSNEVMATRDELGRMVGVPANHVSEIMGELEAVGAVYRRKEGRGVRYFVNPLLGTHLAGAARDKAQAKAPRLQLVE